MRIAGVALAAAMWTATAAAQTAPSGYVSLFADYLPNRSHTAELRSRLFAEEVLDPTPKLLVTGSAFVEGLLGSRSSTRTDAIIRAQEASIAFRGDRVDVLAGFATTAWGRLDELQPTDVINPLDVSRFFFDGRSDARLPVGLARLRYYFSENASLEGVYVPFFRRGRFDQLDERTSPFNAAAVPAHLITLTPSLTLVSLPIRLTRHEPSRSPRNSQGGARFAATTGRVDWSVSAYRGIEPFGLYRRVAAQPEADAVPVDVVYPRFTMIGGDFETVRGPWGIRGEVAAFLRDTFQSASILAIDGSSLDAGAGADRRAGDYRISGTVLLHRESYDAPLDGQRRRTDVSIVISADRTLARERYRLRSFGIYNVSEGTAFLRAIASASLRDDVTFEGSAGWFAGQGPDLVGRFSDSDFACLRLKYAF